MRIWFAVAVTLMLGLGATAQAQAQSLPDAACTTLKALGGKFGNLNRGTDDDRRRFALMVAQQFKFSFPDQGWGTKSAGEGRPQTKDAVARQVGSRLDGWDIVDGSTREVTCAAHVDLPGQTFIPVVATNHLGEIVVVPPPPPPDDIALQQLAVTREILALLQRAAARFGIK